MYPGREEAASAPKRQTYAELRAQNRDRAERGNFPAAPPRGGQDGYGSLSGVLTVSRFIVLGHS